MPKDFSACSASSAFKRRIFSQALQAPQSRILSKINLKADLLFTRGFGRLATQQVVRRQKIGQTA